MAPCARIVLEVSGELRDRHHRYLRQVVQVIPDAGSQLHGRGEPHDTIRDRRCPAVHILRVMLGEPVEVVLVDTLARCLVLDFLTHRVERVVHLWTELEIRDKSGLRACVGKERTDHVLFEPGVSTTFLHRGARAVLVNRGHVHRVDGVLDRRLRRGGYVLVCLQCCHHPAQLLVSNRVFVLSLG